MSFDPYRKWLGIPDNRRPPSYYELLGITAGESDEDVIRSAIDQRRMYILSKKGEGQDGHIKVILGLIEEATSTLLVPEFKHGYDRQLGLHLKKKGSRRSYVLPSWMESRVVRIYGEGSGIVGDLFGIVAIIFGAFALMAILSFTLQKQEITGTESNELTWMEKAALGEGANQNDTPAKPSDDLSSPTKPIEGKATTTDQSSSADVPASVSLPDQVQTTWKPLVKGNDLTGWTGFTKGFHIDEGVLVMQNTKPSERGDIFTEADFADFILRFDFQLPSDANSGIIPRFRSDDSRNIKINIVGKDFKLVAKNGDQIETNPKNNQVGVIIPSGYRGPYIFPDSPVILSPPAWNQMEVSAIGAKLAITVNGARVLDRVFDEFAEEAADKEAWKGRTKGKIGFNNFTGTVRFRDIKIQEVKSQEVVQRSVNPVGDDKGALKAESKSLEQNKSLIDSTLFQGHHYKVFLEAGLDWTTAKNRCDAMGGHLVTISDEQESKFIIALAIKTLSDINNSGIWLGATDERNEGQWKWLDGSPFSYTNWYGAQPNGKEKENYLLLLLSLRTAQGNEIRGWCDQPRGGNVHVIYYACEWDSTENPSKR